MLKKIFVLLAFFTTSCSYNSSEKRLPRFHKSVKDSATVITGPAVDLLFIIDNSGSMEGHQKNLAKNIDLLVGGIFKNPIIDFNIGVLTTDAIYGDLSGNPRIIRRETPNATDKLKQNLLVGTNGNGTETVLQP